MSTTIVCQNVNIAHPHICSVHIIAQPYYTTVYLHTPLILYSIFRTTIYLHTTPNAISYYIYTRLHTTSRTVFHITCYISYDSLSGKVFMEFCKFLFPSMVEITVRHWTCLSEYFPDKMSKQKIMFKNYSLGTSSILVWTSILGCTNYVSV